MSTLADELHVLADKLADSTGLKKHEDYYFFLVRLGDNYASYSFNWEAFRDLAGGSLDSENGAVPVILLSGTEESVARVKKVESPQVHFQISISPFCDQINIINTWLETLVDAGAVLPRVERKTYDWFLKAYNCQPEKLSIKARKFLALEPADKNSQSENNGGMKNNDSTENNDVLSRVIKFFGVHPGILGSLLYLQVSAVGIIYVWFLYQSFNINIFDFAETNDFLLAAFKQPFAFGMSMLTILLIIIQIIVFYFRKQKRMKPGVPWLILGSFIFILIGYTAFPAYFYGKRDARSIIKDQESKVTVAYKIIGPTKKIDVREQNLSLIGTTDKFSFFYDHTKERSLVIPIANIVSIEFGKIFKDSG